jgi:hypothetical protein
MGGMWLMQAYAMAFWPRAALAVLPELICRTFSRGLVATPVKGALPFARTSAVAS